MNETKARQIVAARSGGRCELCATTDPLTFSHRSPKSLGGKWAPSNGIRACGSGTTGCHGWIEANPAKAAEFGWRVTGVDPRGVAAFLILPWPGWWFLDDEGGYVATESDDTIPEGLPPQTLIRL